MGAMLVVYPEWHLPSWLSFLVAIVLAAGMLALLGWALRQIVRDWRRARAADEQHDARESLRLGNRWVAGVVELDEGVPFAVRVEIEQAGTEHRDGDSTTHRWREVARRTFANPFWIRHASGERVSVEPASKVLLIDRIDITVHDEPKRRFRISELSAGEPVFANGKLDRVRVQRGTGYREAPPQEWRLRPDPLGRVQLAAGGLGDRFRVKARRLASRLLIAWLPAALLLGVSLSGFVARAMFGQPAEAVITGKYVTASTDSDGQDTRKHWVKYEGPSGEGHEQLDYDDWRELSVGAHVALLEVPCWRFASALGAAATLHGGVVPLGVLLWVVVFRVLWKARRHDWYEGTLDEKENGPLPRPQASAERVYSRDA